MKRTHIAITVLALIAFMACTSKQKGSTTEEAAVKKLSPIEGNWVTVSFEQNGKISHPKRDPQQFKVFHDGYFSLLAYDTAGNFSFACAGPYEINGNTYKETCTYHSYLEYINFKDWETWEMKGDTLVFYGFEKAIMPDGKDVTNDMNANGKFIEKRVRVKG